MESEESEPDSSELEEEEEEEAKVDDCLDACKGPKNDTSVDSPNKGTLTVPGRNNPVGNDTMSTRAPQVDKDHVQKILTSHFGIDSTNYDEESVVQALDHKDSTRLYEGILPLSGLDTDDPNKGTPKEGSDYTEATTAEDNTQKGSTSPCLNDREETERKLNQGRTIPKGGNKGQ